MEHKACEQTVAGSPTELQNRMLLENTDHLLRENAALQLRNFN
jgi:hypothetical protein